MVNNLDATNEIEKGSDESADGNQSSNGNGESDNIIVAENPIKSYVRRRKCNENVQICEKKKKRESIRRISTILRKNETDRSIDEVKQLETSADIVRHINKRRENQANTKDRVLEKEDPPDVIEAKAKKLADVLSRARHLVCYTGAGISTSARIPDYRGSNGIWTLLQQGKEIGEHDLSLAEPTFTHMALYELHRRNILQYTLSQNCDGLHLRSGIPKRLLSEVHGNMYIEVCNKCKPNVEYWRLFDTTELTARYNHKTNRRCHFCLKPLIDTIVHFGERGRLKWPLNWESAGKHAEKADVILCLGSSLKVLKKYTWLWQMDRPKNKRPKIYILNLQWTPKDKSASLKINGKCDEIMKSVMDFMNIKVTPYDRKKDPIFAHSSLLMAEERHTVSQPMLKQVVKSDDDMETDDNDSNKFDAKMDSQEMDSENSIDGIESNSEQNETNNLSISTEIRIKTEIEAESGTKNEINSKNGQSIGWSSQDMKYDKSTDCFSNANESNVPNLPQTYDNNKTDSDSKGSLQVISSQAMPGSSLPISIKMKDADELRTNEIKAIIAQTVSMKTLPHGPIDGTRDEGYYTSLVNYCRAIEGVIPHWYDVNYAYSGLHSIIHPPPNEVDIWSTMIIPIFKLNRSSAECEFCFDNYAEDKCQFYRPSGDFHATESIRYRHGKRILCECCDYDGGYDDDDDDMMVDEEQNSVDDGEEPKKREQKDGNVSNSEEDDSDPNRTKRTKCDQSSNGDKETGQRIVQPGWYGKGYRKAIKKKKSRRSHHMT